MAVEMVAGIGGEMVMREVADTNKYSKLKVVKKAMSLGIWETIKAKLVEQGVYDLFVMAQDFDGSDPDFVDGVNKVAALLSIEKDKVLEYLADCKA